MGWNHRVFIEKAHPSYDEWVYTIRETYYDDHDKPAMATQEAIGVHGESIESLKWVLDRMKECLEQPVLIFTQTGKIIEYKPKDHESND